MVEYLFSPIIDARKTRELLSPETDTGLDWRALILRYISAGIGIALCTVYRADILVYFNLWSPWPWIGYIVTGILIGRGSNFVHDFASRWLTFQQVDA
jgi:hypothetical protein